MEIKKIILASLFSAAMLFTGSAFAQKTMKIGFLLDFI